jgi:SAM-dependent methyltransferase
VHEWWGDPRCHFGTLDDSSPVLSDRSDLQAAIEFILVQLGLDKGGKILDLCCGPGRYVVELAQRGLDVVGIDLNEDYVTLARRLAEQEGVAAELLVGDMREVPYVNCFDAVINVGTSFGFFETEAEDQRAIESLAGALKPGGCFLLEMGNRDYYLKNFEATNSSENSDGSVTEIRRSFDYVRSRINATFRRSASRGPLETWSHSWRAYTLAEIAGLLAHGRLDVVSAFGGWRSEAYSVDTSRMIVISERGAAI